LFKVNTLSLNWKVVLAASQ